MKSERTHLKMIFDKEDKRGNESVCISRLQWLIHGWNGVEEDILSYLCMTLASLLRKSME